MTLGRLMRGSSPSGGVNSVDMVTAELGGDDISSQSTGLYSTVTY